MSIYVYHKAKSNAAQLSETKKLKQGRSLAPYCPSTLGLCRRGWHHYCVIHEEQIVVWFPLDSHRKATKNKQGYSSTVLYTCRLGLIRRGQVWGLDWPQMELYVVNTGHSGITSVRLIIYKAHKEDRCVRWLLRVGRNENKQLYHFCDIYILKHFKSQLVARVSRLLVITYLDHPRVSISEMSWE